jgi:hypothetical protein
MNSWPERHTNFSLILHPWDAEMNSQKTLEDEERFFFFFIGVLMRLTTTWKKMGFSFFTRVACVPCSDDQRWDVWILRFRNECVSENDWSPSNVSRDEYKPGKSNGNRGVWGDWFWKKRRFWIAGMNLNGDLWEISIDPFSRCWAHKQNKRGDVIAKPRTGGRESTNSCFLDF